jgi:hypothetical protein
MDEHRAPEAVLAVRRGSPGATALPFRGKMICRGKWTLLASTVLSSSHYHGKGIVTISPWKLPCCTQSGFPLRHR